MTMNPPGLALASLAGLALGSYAVTAAIRFSRAESSVTGRSHCDACGVTLGYLQTLPLVSYLSAKGACRACATRIDPAHLVGEMCGLLVLATAFVTGDLIRGPLLAALGLALIATSAIDWKTGRLPDLLTAGIALAGAVLSALRSFEALQVGLLAAAIAFGMLQPIRWISLRLRGDPGLGFGDVKLIGALALWLGVATPWMVVVAAALGLVATAVLRPSGGRLHFGPALAAAAWIVGIAVEWDWWPTTV